MPALLEAPVYGQAVTVLDGIVRLTCENPSVMTGPGTNTYLVGHEALVAIDPGPEDDAHVDAVAAAAQGKLRAILVTHTHPDHSPGAARLAALTGAPVLGLGRRDGFEPDTLIRDGDQVVNGDIAIEALHTPGHASNHLAYIVRTGDEVVLFSGDHVMSGSTVVIAPPDGDMAHYLKSLHKVLDLEPPATVIAPGHGSVVSDPRALVEYYVSHRLQREAAVLASLTARRQAIIEEIVTDVYTDVPEALHPIARFSVWAHLRKLRDEAAVTSDDPDEVTATWSVG
jgi:glyoxylase-like metal-dependent hydrolase (beta-lactamase superfamily II)